MTFLDTADQIHTTTRDTLAPAVLTIGEAQGGRGTVYDTADEFRRRLLAGEVQATTVVIDHYRTVQTELRRQVDALLKIYLDPDSTMTAAQGRALERLTQLDAEIQRTVSRYAARVEADLAGIYLDAGRLGADQAEDLVRLQLPSNAAAAGIVFDRLPDEAVAQMVAAVTDGPVADLLAALGPDMVAELRQTLVDGVALGLSPRETARRMLATVDMPRWRALNIARTETMRAFREANRRSLTRNRRIVTGWRWSAALDSRTCPVCWAMHGTEFPTETTFGSHPSCRCAPIPVTKSWAELGLPDVEDAPVLQMTDGPTLFDRQPQWLQRSVLGPGKYQAFADGRLRLADVVGERFDPTWGPVRFEKPLGQLVGQET